MSQAQNRNSASNQSENADPEDYYIVPDKRGGRLRACISCKLLKAEYQWHYGCENCPDIQATYGELDNWTTPAFTGVMALMDPTQSWVSKRQRVIELAPGLYALVVQGTLVREEDIDVD